MIIFHFIFKMLKNPILKVELSRFFQKNSTCTKCLILQNGLHVDEILIKKKINLVEPQKILMYYQIMNVIIIIDQNLNMK
jgi:hypothetical protein